MNKSLVFLIVALISSLLVTPMARADDKPAEQVSVEAPSGQTTTNSVVDRPSDKAVLFGEIGGLQLLPVVVSIVCVLVCVLLHYEALLALAKFLKSTSINRRPRVLILIFGILTAHIVEIGVFGLGYYFLSDEAKFGYLVGPMENGLFDYLYFSATVFTTLGFGDLAPVGSVRFMAGLEALMGFVMVTWSASFTFLEMEKFWRD